MRGRESAFPPHSQNYPHRREVVLQPHRSDHKEDNHFRKHLSHQAQRTYPTHMHPFPTRNPNFRPFPYPQNHSSNHPTIQPFITFPNSIPVNGEGDIGWTEVRSRKNRRIDTASRASTKLEPNILPSLVDIRSNLISVFVDNLRPEVDSFILRRMFQSYGKVRDIFIPRKARSGREDRYGFVRYSSVHEAEEAIRKTNGSECLGKRMVVRLARRAGGHSRGKGEVSSKEPRPRQNSDHFNKLAGGRTFSEVVKGEQEIRHSAEAPNSLLGGDFSRKKELVQREKVVSINFEPEPENEKWLRASAVVCVRNPNDRVPLYERFFEEEIEMECLAPMGGNLMLLSFASRDEMMNTLHREKGFLNRWFSMIEPWSPQILCKERVVWLRCEGIPLQLWSLNFFKAMGEVWGRFVFMEEEFYQRRKLDEVRFLIATESEERIKGTVNVEWEGRSVPIAVEEEPRSVNFPGVHFSREGPTLRRSESCFSRSSDDSSDDWSPPSVFQATSRPRYRDRWQGSSVHGTSSFTADRVVRESVAQYPEGAETVPEAKDDHRCPFILTDQATLKEVGEAQSSSPVTKAQPKDQIAKDNSPNLNRSNSISNPEVQNNLNKIQDTPPGLYSNPSPISPSPKPGQGPKSKQREGDPKSQPKNLSIF